MKIVAIVQARLGSRRLPRKVLLPIAGRPLLAHVLERVKQIQGIDQWIVLAIPHEDRADISEALWQSKSRLGTDALKNVVIFDPPIPENDVLRRYALAAAKFGATAALRATADCPLLSPEASSLVVQRYAEGDVDYASNVGIINRWPDGWDTEVISTEALEHMDRTLTDPKWREHVTSYLRESAHSFRTASVRSPIDRSREKLSVDTIADLNRVRELMLEEVA